MRQQVLVNGPLGISHWKRFRVHQEADSGPPLNDRGDSRGARDRRVDRCGRVERMEAAVATVVVTAVVTAEIVVRIVTTTAALTVQFFPAEMIGTKNVEVVESSMIRWIMDIGVTSVSQIEICDGCGMSVGLLVGSASNLEHPPSGGFDWNGTETDLEENVLELEADDLDEKIINDGVEAKRFEVRAWGGVHMSQSGQENPGAHCGDKDSDIEQIDDEECDVKDWRHTQRSNVKQRGETGVDAIRRENEAVGCSMG